MDSPRWIADLAHIIALQRVAQTLRSCGAGRLRQESTEPARVRRHSRVFTMTFSAFSFAAFPERLVGLHEISQYERVGDQLLGVRAPVVRKPTARLGTRPGRFRNGPG